MDRGATVDGRANKRGGEMSNRSIQGLAKEREGGRRERENERWSGLRYKAPHGPLGRTCINETQPRSNRIPDRPRHVIPVLDRGLVSKIMLNRCSTCNLYRLQFDFFRIFFFFFLWFHFRINVDERRSIFFVMDRQQVWVKEKEQNRLSSNDLILCV